MVQGMWESAQMPHRIATGQMQATPENARKFAFDFSGGGGLLSAPMRAVPGG